jgi:hypothetical protein
VENALPEFRIDFAVIGAQKCGTTALWNYLRNHPQIARSERKELHYFDSCSETQTKKYFQANESFQPGFDRSQLHGDFTPSYLFHPFAVSRLIGHNPDVKCIVLLRDPVERAFSHWRMQIARNIETLSFSDAIRSGRSRIMGISPDEPAFRQFSYVERGFYGQQIERLLSQVHRDNCLFLSFRDLRSRPQSLIDEVCGFLRIERIDLIENNAIDFSFNSNLIEPINSNDSNYLFELYLNDRINAEKIVEFSI